MAGLKKLRFMGCVRPILALLFILLVAAMAYGCNIGTNGKGAINNMQTHFIGRFSIAVPAEMEQKTRSSKMRSVEIQEIIWPNNLSQEKARTAEWEHFMSEVKKLDPPDGVNRVIIKTNDFPALGRWAKGIFYYNNSIDDEAAVWTLLMDAGEVGVWLKGNPSVVEKENLSHKMVVNIENIAKSYQPLNPRKLVGQQPLNCFYLQHGVINLPYLVDEMSIARFEGNALDLKLLVEMEMDVRHEIESMGLIKKTRGLLAAALITPGGSISKVRLGKREVAGMPGEEAVLKVREGSETELVFTWEYNGKDDSGEYPTTRINMESPDGNLDKKLKIWDAVLDSMKPMFERKK